MNMDDSTTSEKSPGAVCVEDLHNPNKTKQN
jgi:hypothetical protein